MYYIYILYLALPCFVANILPVLFNRLQLLPTLKKPLDNGKYLGQARLFGDHKTWRGLISGVVGAMLVAAGQWLLAEVNWVPLPLFQSWQFIIFGFLASLVKRQLKVASGEPFVVLDQLDYIIGFLLLTSLVVTWNWHDMIFLLLFSLIAHPISNGIAYIFNIKKTYW